MKSRWIIAVVICTLTAYQVWHRNSLTPEPKSEVIQEGAKEQPSNIILDAAQPNLHESYSDEVHDPNIKPASSEISILSEASVESATSLAEFEQQFFTGKLLKIDKMIAATEAEQFTNLFHSLESLAVAPDMRIKTQALNDKIRSLPAIQGGDIGIQRFACGSRFCAASFSTQNEDVWKQFQNSLSSALELPEGGASFVNRSGTQGNWEQRLIFSTDGESTEGILVQFEGARPD